MVNCCCCDSQHHALERATHKNVLYSWERSSRINCNGATEGTKTGNNFQQIYRTVRMGVKRKMFSYARALITVREYRTVLHLESNQIRFEGIVGKRAVTSGASPTVERSVAVEQHNNT